MKRLLFFAFLISAFSMQAQTIETLLGAEKTAAGMILSARIGFATKRNFASGVFFQMKSPKRVSETAENLETFTGAYFQVPIATTEKILVTFALNGGLVNYKFLVVTPLLETRIMLTKKTGIVFGAGYRYGYPSISSSVLYRFKSI